MAELFQEKQLIKKKEVISSKSAADELHDIASTMSVPAHEELKDKVICLFFSASWCAPCHHFVPMLRDVYTELVRRAEPIEVVFVSFDKTDADMMDYYGNHHGNWLALPFEDPFREVLAERYSISMVPKLIVIQPDGEVITTKGRKDIQDKGLICMRGWHSALKLGGTTTVPEEDQTEQKVS